LADSLIDAAKVPVPMCWAAALACTRFTVFVGAFYRSPAHLFVHFFLKIRGKQGNGGRP
jgi:hypothetical protein